MKIIAAASAVLALTIATTAHAGNTKPVALEPKIIIPQDDDMVAGGFSSSTPLLLAAGAAVLVGGLVLSNSGSTPGTN